MTGVTSSPFATVGSHLNAYRDSLIRRTALLAHEAEGGVEIHTRRSVGGHEFYAHITTPDCAYFIHPVGAWQTAIGEALTTALAFRLCPVVILHGGTRMDDDMILRSAERFGFELGRVYKQDLVNFLAGNQGYSFTTWG